MMAPPWGPILLQVLGTLMLVGAAINICPHRCECYVQGQYHALHCENADFKQIEARFGSNQPQVIHFGDNKLRELPDDALSVYPIVKFLNVSHNFIRKVEAYALRDVKWLEWLDLSHNALRLHHSLHPRFMENGGQVQWLSLAENEDIGLELQRLSVIEESNMTTWLESSHLKNLSLARCKLQRLPAWMVRGLTSLEHLDVSYNELKVLPTMTLVSMCRLGSMALQVNQWSCRRESCTNLRALYYLLHPVGDSRDEIQGNEIFCPELHKAFESVPNCDIDLAPEEKERYEACLRVQVPEPLVYTPPLSFWLIVGIVAGCIIGFVFLAIICNSIVTAVCKKRRTQNTVAAHQNRHTYDEELALRLKSRNSINSTN